MTNPRSPSLLNSEYSENLMVRVPPGFKTAMRELARREYCPSISDLIRRCLLARFREAGIKIAPIDQESHQ